MSSTSRAALEAARMACHFDGLRLGPLQKARRYLYGFVHHAGSEENNDNNNNDLLWQRGRGGLASESRPCKPQIHEFMKL
jgi:hypothetical protein